MEMKCETNILLPFQEYNVNTSIRMMRKISESNCNICKSSPAGKHSRRDNAVWYSQAEDQQRWYCLGPQSWYDDRWPTHNVTCSWDHVDSCSATLLSVQHLTSIWYSVSHAGRQRVAADLISWPQTAFSCSLWCCVCYTVDLDVDNEGEEGVDDKDWGDDGGGYSGVDWIRNVYIITWSPEMRVWFVKQHHCHSGYQAQNPDTSNWDICPARLNVNFNYVNQTRIKSLNLLCSANPYFRRIVS